MSSFYAFVGSAECGDIQILTTCYFNSFGGGGGGWGHPVQYIEIRFLYI